MTPLSEEALVARQLAALRAANWSVGDALALVVNDLGDVGLKSRLSQAAAALKAGRAENAADLFSATLAHGDSATAVSLSQLADSLDTLELSRHRGRQAGLLVALIWAGALSLCFGATAMLEAFRPLYGVTVPAPTQLAIDVLGFLRNALPGLALVGGAVVALAATRTGWVPGTRLLTSSASLRSFSGAVRSGVPEAEALRLVDSSAPSLAASLRLALDPIDRCYLRCDGERRGLATAAATLADELEERGRAATDAFGFWSSMLTAFVGVILLSLVIIAFYLPIFSMAGAIR